MGREKKMRVLCNFCDCSGSRFELRPHGQYQGALSSVGRELSRLRLLTRRMTGKDLDGLNFAELHLLESQLKDALLIVQNQKKEVKLQEDERLYKHQTKKGAEVKDGLCTERSSPYKFFGSSSEDRPQERDDEAPGLRVQKAFERRMGESTQMEFEPLWILNERMNGRDLDGMTFFELLLLEGRILDGLESVQDHKLGPRMEEAAR